MVWLVVLVPVCCMLGVVGPEVAQAVEDWPGSDSQTFHLSLGQMPGPTPVSTRQSLCSKVQHIQSQNTHMRVIFITFSHSSESLSYHRTVVVVLRRLLDRGWKV